MSLTQTFSKIIITNSGTANAAPQSDDLSHGELAINYNDGNLYFKNAANDITVLASVTAKNDAIDHANKTDNPHQVTASLLGLAAFEDKTPEGLIISNATNAALGQKANADDFNDLVALSGRPSGSTTLGSFTYNIINDDETIKGALQDLEDGINGITSTENGSLTTLDNTVDALITLTGRSSGSTTLGTFTGTIISDNLSIKGALQSLETNLETIGADLLDLTTNDGGVEIGLESSTTFGGAIGNNAVSTTGGAIGYNTTSFTGFAGGEGADSTSGGAVGQNSEATTGGAVGQNSEATTGGAIGEGATSQRGGAAVGKGASALEGVTLPSLDSGGGAIGFEAKVQGGGFAGGKLAEAFGGSAAIGAGAKATINDAVQLGIGTNSVESTIQFKNSGSVTSAQFGEVANIIGKHENISNLITLTGVSADEENLGPFDGTIIKNSRTIKQALQDLEDNFIPIFSGRNAKVIITGTDVPDAHGSYYKYGETDFVHITSPKYVKYSSGSPVGYILPFEQNEPEPPFNYVNTLWRIYDSDNNLLAEAYGAADVPPTDEWFIYVPYVTTWFDLVATTSDYSSTATNPFNNVYYVTDVADNVGLRYHSDNDAIQAYAEQSFLQSSQFGTGAVDLSRYRTENSQTASGDYSVNTGYSGTAKGNYSTHMGSGGTAEGNYSTHMGSGGTASGPYSTHIGRQGVASGWVSTHIGRQGVASGEYSTHIGKGGTAEGDYSTHMGNSGTASGHWSTHMGSEGIAEGDYSTHMGKGGTAKGLYSTHMGSGGTAEGDYSTHMGYQGTASGLYSTHMGKDGTASGLFSTHMGANGTASGLYSTHMGYQGTASGLYSTHMGYKGIAKGDYSTHIGYEGVAEGDYSTHMGKGGTASGLYSTHMGWNGIAEGPYSTHMGQEGIAEGDFSTHMGSKGVASGGMSTHMGYRGTASGGYSTHMGNSGTASGDGSTHMGNSGTASGDYSTHMGSEGIADRSNQVVMSPGHFETDGDRQYSVYQLRAVTTGGTATKLTESSAGTIFFATEINKTYSIEINLVGRSSDGLWIHSGKYHVCVTRDAGDPYLVGTLQEISEIRSDSSTTTRLAAAFSNTLGSFTFSVTGEAATNIRWNAVLQMNEIGY